MNIIKVFSTITLDSIDRNFVTEKTNAKTNLSKSEKRFLLKIMGNYKTTDVNDVLKSITLFAIWHPDEAIKEARKKGVFRYKSYGFNNNTALYLLEKLLKKSDLLNFSLTTIEFIEKKINLSFLYDIYKDTEEKIKKFILVHHHIRKKFKIGPIEYETSLFKEILAYLDFLFYKRKKTLFLENKDKLDNFTTEDIAEAGSYIIFMYNKLIGIKADINYTVDPKFVLANEIEYPLLLVCKMNYLEEIELYTDFFNYGAKINSKDILISTNDDTLDQSIEFGFIKRDLQGENFLIKMSDENEKSVSIYAMMEYTIKKMGNQIEELKNDPPFSRYIYRIPIPILEHFKSDKLFKEEILGLLHLSKEIVLPLGELINKKVTTNCTIHDVVLFQRFFIIMNSLNLTMLYQKKDKEKIIKSLIPAHDTDGLKSILNIFINDITKTNELLDMFTYNKEGFKLDLQYTPFIHTSNHYLFSATIASKSNLVRNIIAYSYMIKNQIVNNDGDKESLVSTCSSIFQEIGYTVIENKKFRYNGENGEIDLIVINDTSIILIECKSPLYPTSIFEMRSSYNHLEKAKKQLDLSLRAFNDKAFLNKFIKDSKINYSCQNIKTCIMFGNRMFSGYKGFGHPIRYIYELETVLNDGTIYSYFGNWRIWKYEVYSHDDLINFLDDNNSFVALSLKSMKKVKKYFHLKGKKIIKESNILDMMSLVEIYDKNLKLIYRSPEAQKAISDYNSKERV